TDTILGPTMNRTIGTAGIPSATISWSAPGLIPTCPTRMAGTLQNWTNMAPGIRFQPLEQSGAPIVIRVGFLSEPVAGPGTILLDGPGYPMSHGAGSPIITEDGLMQPAMGGVWCQHQGIIAGVLARSIGFRVPRGWAGCRWLLLNPGIPMGSTRDARLFPGIVVMATVFPICLMRPFSMGPLVPTFHVPEILWLREESLRADPLWNQLWRAASPWLMLMRSENLPTKTWKHGERCG